METLVSRDAGHTVSAIEGIHASIKLR